MSFESHYATSY